MITYAVSFLTATVTVKINDLRILPANNYISTSGERFPACDGRRLEADQRHVRPPAPRDAPLQPGQTLTTKTDHLGGLKVPRKAFLIISSILYGI